MGTVSRRGLGKERAAVVAGKGDTAVYSSGVRSRCLRFVAVLATVVSIFWAAPAVEVWAAPGEFAGGVERVADGDSLEVRRDGEVVRVRLHGIDCPEWDQPGGRAAARFTRQLAAGRPVTVWVREIDEYGRLVGEVLLPDGRSLNRVLVGSGHAWWYRRYSRDSELERLEAVARDARRGLWGGPDPLPPWRWRREHPR